MLRLYLKKQVCIHFYGVIMQAHNEETELLKKRFEEDIFPVINNPKLSVSYKNEVLFGGEPDADTLLKWMAVLEMYMAEEGGQKKADMINLQLEFSVKRLNEEQKHIFNNNKGSEKLENIKWRKVIRDITKQINGSRKLSAKDLYQMMKDLAEIRNNEMASPGMKKAIVKLTEKTFKQFLEQLKSEITTAKYDSEEGIKSARIFLHSAEKLLKRKGVEADEVAFALSKANDISDALSVNAKVLTAAMQPMSDTDSKEELNLVADITKSLPAQLKETEKQGDKLAKMKVYLEKKGRSVALSEIKEHTQLATKERRNSLVELRELMPDSSLKQLESEAGYLLRDLQYVARPYSAESTILLALDTDSDMSMKLAAMRREMETTDNYEVKKDIIEREKNSIINKFIHSTIIPEYGNECVPAFKKYIDSRLQFLLSQALVTTNIVRYERNFNGHEFQEPFKKLIERIGRDMEANSAEEKHRNALTESQSPKLKPKAHAEKEQPTQSVGEKEEKSLEAVESNAAFINGQDAQWAKPSTQMNARPKAANPNTFFARKVTPPSSPHPQAQRMHTAEKVSGDSPVIPKKNR